MVFELIDGGELFDEIVSKTTYTELDAHSYMIPIFLALQYIHHLRIMHRDLKPENILLKNENGAKIIKIADFGVSR